MTEHWAAHDLYDEETTSPRDEVKQKFWEEKIDDWLEEYEVYRTPHLSLPVK